MRPFLGALATGVAFAAFLVGCGGSSPKPTLTGGIRFYGRVPPGYTASGYQRGLVQILRHGRVVASAHLSQGQGYGFVLTPGAYNIRTWGNATPSYPPCPLTPVTIRAGRTARANVSCEFH